MAEWRTIGQLADLVGGYGWVEHRLFILCGEWAVADRDDDPEVTVFWATQARRHGVTAEAWRDRLPVRAGVDRQALITPPVWNQIPVQTVLERLAAQPDQRQRLAGLTEVVLSQLLLGAYRRHADSATSIAEGPVQPLLEVALQEGEKEVVVGRSLWQRLAGASANGPAHSSPDSSLLEGLVRA